MKLKTKKDILDTPNMQNLVDGDDGMRRECSIGDLRSFPFYARKQLLLSARLK